MDADGKNQTRLSPPQARDLRPIWSPNSKKIAFWASGNKKPGLYIMDADGKNQTWLTDHKGSNVRSPTWSPDGKKIGFCSSDITDAKSRIYVMDADSKNQAQLIENNASFEVGPSWSPDGKKIAFTSGKDGNPEIYVTDVDGKNRMRLTENNTPDEHPSWSPDGKKIAFISIRNGNPGIYVMDTDGRNQTKLIAKAGNGAWLENYGWLAGGKKILFCYNVVHYNVKTKGDRWHKREMYIIDSDGKNEKKLMDAYIELPRKG